jgi:Right handed beta helix region
MPRRLLVLIACAVVGLAVAGLSRATESDPAAPARAAADDPAPSAAVAPAANGDRFVAPDGSDGNRCRTPATACATFGRAYRSAKPGHVVEVAAGEYPPQDVLADPRKATKKRHVTFRPAEGAVVELGGLTLGSGDSLDGPRHLTFSGFRTTYVSAGEQRGIAALPGTRDVTLRNIDAGNFTLWGVQHVRVRGGDWGPCAIHDDADCGNAKIDAGPAGARTRNVLVTGARFHDFRFSPACYQEGQDCHFECMYVNGSRNVTIRDNVFEDCALYDIFVTLSGPDAAAVGQRGMTIERNRFATPWDESRDGPARRQRFSALALNWCQNSQHGYEDVLIRGNRFSRNTGILVDPNPECSFRNVRVVGNRMAFDGCDPRWSYANNRWTTEVNRGRCGRSDRIVD